MPRICETHLDWTDDFGLERESPYGKRKLEVRRSENRGVLKHVRATSTGQKTQSTLKDRGVE